MTISMIVLGVILINFGIVSGAAWVGRKLSEKVEK